MVKCTAVDALQVTQDHTALGKLLSAPVIALLLGLLGAAAGILPVQCTAYDVVWQYVMPLAAALILLESDLRECAFAATYLHDLLPCALRLLVRLSGRRLSGTDVQVLVGFGIASLGTILGTFVAYATFKTHLGADGWKASPCST